MVTVEVLFTVTVEVLFTVKDTLRDRGEVMARGGVFMTNGDST